ncbi:MAG: alpha/beta hydrolase, partial [Ramlibacter sp.]
WIGQLRHLVFLGTPHHGAPLERAGNWVDVLLGTTPYTRPFSRLVQLRSAGITDLRYGHVLQADWDGQDRFRRAPDRREILPLPAGVACYAVAATTAGKRSAVADRLLGDGLVPLRSALGQHDDPSRSLAFPKSAQWIGYRMNHMVLLHHPEVTQQLVRWLSPTAV